MGSSKKRKYDALDTPRITYDTPTRIFDRLFKEDSLDGLKETVRKKLGVPLATSIHLTQLRDGITVDLEDDDDFEAFQSAIYSTSVARLKVVVGDSDQAVHPNGPELSGPEVVETMSVSKRKKKKKKYLSPDSSRAATPTTSVGDEDAQDIQDERPAKKRRVSFAAPSTEALTRVNDQHSSEKSKTISKAAKSKDASTVSSNGESSAHLPEKKKKKKTSTSVEAEVSEEPVEEISDDKKKKKKGKEKDKGDINAAVDEVGGTKSKSKKRARSTSPERPSEKSSSKTDSALSVTTEKPKKPAKKSKKAVEDLETAADEGSDKPNPSSESTRAPTTTVATEPSTEPPSKAKKDKKKASSKETEKPAESVVSSGSSPPEKDVPVTVDKKLTKKKSKADLETEKTSEVPSLSEPAPPKGKRANSDTVKPSKKAQPAASTDTPSAEPVKTPTPLTSSAETPSGKLSMESVASAMAAKILAKMASKQSVAEKKTFAAPEMTTPAPSGPSPAIETSSSKELAISATVAPTKTKMPAPTPAVIEAPSSKEPTATTTTANSSDNSKLTASTTTQNKAAPAKPPRLTAAQRKNIRCPVCDECPTHARSRCPTVKSGVKALRKRIKELENADAEDHADLIEELQALIDKKTKKPRVPGTTGTKTGDKAGDHAEADDAASNSPEKSAPPAPSVKPTATTPKAPAKVASTAPLDLPEPPSSDEEESPPVEPSRSPSLPPTQPRPSAPESPAAPSKGPAASSQKQDTQKSKPKKSRGYDKDSSQLLDTSDISLASIGLPGGLLGFGTGDISALTEGDIEAIIRGPRPSLNSKDLVSSSSSSESEDDDGLEADVLLDEEEEEKSENARRAERRLSKMSARSDSSDEELVPVSMRGRVQEDDDDDDDNTSAGDVTLQRNAIEASIVRPSAAPSAGQSEDIPNESSSSPSPSLPSREQSFGELNDNENSDTLDTSMQHVINGGLSEEIGPKSPEPEDEGDGEGQVEDTSLEMKAQAQAETAHSDTDASVATVVPTDIAEAVAGEESATANADSPSSESSENSTNTSEADPIEVEAPQPSQGDPIHSDAEDDDDNDASAQAESTPKEKVTARTTRSSQRNKVGAESTNTSANSTPAPPSTLRLKAVTAASTQPSQSGLSSVPPKSTRKASQAMKKISELPVPPHPNGSIRIIKPAQVAVVARTTRSRSAAVAEPEKDRDDSPALGPESEDESESQPEPPTQPERSIALTRGRRAGSVVPKTPAKTPAAKGAAKTRATSKQAPASSQVPETPAATKAAAKPPSKAATQTPAAKPAPKAAAIRTTRARTARRAADLAEESDDGEAAEEQNTTINGHAPAAGDKEAGNKSLASWDVLQDRSSQGPDLSGISSPTQNMVDELASSSRAATPKASQVEQPADTEAHVQDGEGEGTEEAWQTPKDPLFLYDESQQSFPYSQYPGLMPKPSQEDSDDEEDEVESTILKGPLAEITKPRASGPFRSLTEISSQSQRDFFAPRYSSQLPNMAKPAVQDMYGLTGDDDDDEGSDGSDSESDSEAERKANNSHIPETRRAGVSSKRK